MINTFAYEIATLMLVLGASSINYRQLRNSRIKREATLLDKQKGLTKENESLEENLNHLVTTNEVLTEKNQHLQQDLTQTIQKNYNIGRKYP
jgi:uncharacterized protein HemX